MNKTLIFLLATIVLDAVGIGLMVPIVPELIKELGGLSISDAAVYGGLMTALFSVAQFVATPILGSLSDALGRRPLLLISLFAFGLNYIILAFAPTLPWLFLGQFLAGLFSATPAIASAYIADIVPPEKRAKYFGMLGAAFGFGFMIGPVLSGLVATIDIRAPFFLAAALVLTNVAYGFFILPETLSKDQRKRFSLARANLWGAIRHYRQYPNVLLLIWAYLAIQLALQTIVVIWPYFTSFSFGWGAKMVGISLGFFGVMNIINQGFLVGRLVDSYGERNTSQFALSLFVVGLIGYGFVSDAVWLFIITVPVTVGLMSMGSINGFISRQIPVTEQGGVQGLITGLNSLAAIVAPLTIPRIFQATTSDPATAMPGAVFFIGTFFALLAMVLINRTQPARPSNLT